MSIVHSDIAPGNEDLGRRVLVVARGIAPCIDTLEGEPLADALAVLRGVVASLPAPGTRGIASQRVGPAAVTYQRIRDSFDAESRAALRLLCGTAAADAGPVGSFPEPGVVAGVWPEVWV